MMMSYSKHGHGAASVAAISSMSLLTPIQTLVAKSQLIQTLVAKSQLSKPTDRSTIQWIVQRFEGISLIAFPSPCPPQQDIAGPEPLHERVLDVLGPAYEEFCKPV